MGLFWTDLVRLDLFRRGWVACFIRHSAVYIHKTNMSLKKESIFLEINLPKLKHFIVGILYRSLDNINFVSCIDQIFGVYITLKTSSETL